MAVKMIRLVGFTKEEALALSWDEAELWIEALLEVEKEIPELGLRGFLQRT